MIRNSLDHGIEAPEERIRKSKPPRAKIGIKIRTQRGNQIEVIISDDGGGIDTDKLRRSAVKSGKITKEQSRTMDEKAAQQLIFLSDVSTSSGVTEISGRGLGMAIVRDHVKKLGGTLVVDSKKDVGTTFTIVLPLTLATFRGILIQCSEQKFVFPTFAIERVLRIRPDKDIRQVEQDTTIYFEGHIVPLMHLADRLGLARENRQAQQYLTLVIESGEKRVALVVDEILAEQEVLVRELKPPLSFVPVLSGVSVLGNGELAPILKAEYLVGSSGQVSSSQARTETKKRTKPSDYRILLADDSITSRTLLRSIIESAGYSVKTAIDGAEALEILKSGDWDLLVSDIEMPRLNGLELTRRVRSELGLADLPIILCSTLDGEDDKRRGLETGANDYIVKGGRSQTSLIAAIKELL